MKNISLIHPSYGRPQRARNVALQVIGAASENVDYEYLLGVDQTDPLLTSYLSLELPKQARIVMVRDLSLVNTANVLAAEAVGEIISMVIDHIEYPKDWDVQYEQVAAHAFGTEYVLDIDDGDKRSHYWTNFAVFSKAYRDAHMPLFYPGYKHYYADVDFWDVARLRGKLIPARHIKFVHNHYANNPQVQRDATYARSESFGAHDQQVYHARKSRNYAD